MSKGIVTLLAELSVDPPSQMRRRKPGAQDRKQKLCLGSAVPSWVVCGYFLVVVSSMPLDLGAFSKQTVNTRSAE